MNTQTLYNDGGDRKINNNNNCYRPPFAFVVESVDAVDGGALMVASEEEEVLGIFDFVGEKETDCLQ